jgi:hypothetical protein
MTARAIQNKYRTAQPKYPEKSLPDNRSEPIWGNANGTAPYRASGRLFRPRPSRLEWTAKGRGASLCIGSNQPLPFAADVQDGKITGAERREDLFLTFGIGYNAAYTTAAEFRARLGFFLKSEADFARHRWCWINALAMRYRSASEPSPRMLLTPSNTMRVFSSV